MNKKISTGILISAIILVSGCTNEKPILQINENLSSPFGVAFGEGSSNLDNFMDYIHDLGVRRTKVSFFWHKIEPEDGKYNAKKLDEYLDQLQPGDRALLNVFTTGWATNKESPKGATFKNEECKEKYREFIVDLVEHTQRKITYWQRDTEPASARHYPTERFEEYVEAQKIFYEAVKSVQPDAIVIGVNANGNFKGGEHSSADFFDYVICYGKDYFDMLDIRLYEDKYDIPMKVEWFRNKMKEYGYEKPIVCTEFGGPDPREFPEQYQSLSKVIQPEYASGNIDEAFAKLDSMREEGLVPPEIDMFLVNTSPELEEKRNRIHCRDLIQRHLIILDSDVKELWYWNLQSSGLHPIFGKMRLMEPENWEKLPPYYCYQRMIQQIGNVKAVKRVSTKNENIYLFNLTMQDDSTKYVIWERRDMFYGEDQPSTPFEFKTDWKKVKITDVFGTEEIMETEDGILKLDISDTPVFIEEVSMEETLAVENEGVLLGISPDGKGWLEEIDGQLILHLSGSGYEMGYQHGYLLKEEIRRAINAYVYHGLESTGNPPSSPKTIWNNVKSYVPQRYLDEMQGLADGAGVPLIDVQIIQVQAELESIFLCEQITVWGSATTDGDLYHGRNLGFPTDKRDDSSGVAIQDHAIVIIAQPDGYNSLVLLSWPGFIGACNGMNDKGISLAINAGFNSVWNPGLARALRFRKALEEADDIDEAADILDHAKTVGAMLTLSDGKIPKAYVVEMHGKSLYAGEWNDPVEEHDGYYSIKDCVRRMNQYIIPALAETQTTPEGKTIGLRPPSQEYFDVSEFIEGHHGKIDLDLMKEVLITKTSHRGAEGGCVRTSVCRGSTLDFWVANAVGSSNSVDQKFYHYNLNTLLSSTIPDRTDKLMPQVTITSPVGGSTVSGIITITGTASDNVGVSRVEIMVDDDGYSLADGTITWITTIDTSSWEKGSWHRIKVRAIDESGNGAIDIIGLKKENCPEDCIVTGFEGNNFGGDLLWYGIHSWKTNNETLNGFQTIFDDVGMEMARFDIYWGKLEPEKGVYNWTLTDTLLNTVDENIPVLLTVFCTSKWGSKYNEYREEIAEILGIENMSEIYNRPPSAPPVNMEDYMDFLDVLVNRYKDRVQYWMIDNEVHSAKYYDGYGLPEGLLISKFWIGAKEEYVDLLKNSSLKIKQVDNNATVLASNFMKHEGNEEFTDFILEEGKDYFDILALNLYGCPEDDIDRITEMKSKMNAFGYDKPIWITEHGEIDIGCHTEQKFRKSFDSPEELKLQSEEIVKRHVLAFSAGVKKLFRLSLTMQNEEWSATGKFVHMGLTFDTAGNKRKPGFYTNRMMIEKLKDFISVEKIDSGIYKFSFSTRDPVYVLWSDVGEKTIDLSKYLSTPNAKMTHIVTELDVNNNPVYLLDELVPADSITVDETPIFVEETE